MTPQARRPVATPGRFLQTSLSISHGGSRNIRSLLELGIGKAQARRNRADILSRSPNPMHQAIVVSLVNMKGGVGKTTVAVNLANYLARDHQKQVRLLDLDPQTNAALILMPERAWAKWVEEHGSMADV